MRFALSPEQLNFTASVRELLATSDVASAVRSWSAGDYRPGRALWGRLADTGLTALGLSEPQGGFGATTVDLVLGFEELGRFAVPGPFVESVAVLPVLLDGTADSALVTAIGAGEVLATLAMPPHVPYAVDAAAADAIYLLEAGQLHRAKAGERLESVDGARRLGELVADRALAESRDSGRAFAIGALATAAQLLGAGHALLERAGEYAKQRVQFGRPIGQFQAVKHQLADALVGLEFARPLLLAGALAIGERSGTLERDVSAAKVACTDAAYRAARTSLQVHGAIGYTDEYDLSLWLRKVRALTSAWGTQQVHRSRVLAAL
ncbi:MAG: acyl-CoA dehydrogenase family protein [Actinomycetota bacterium]|nr:acyl-CoA dehydrogenase family protein [Actinomycetota bacterium]